MKRNQSIKHQSPGSGEAPNSKLRSGSRFLTLVGSVLLALAFGCAKPRTENSNGISLHLPRLLPDSPHAAFLAMIPYFFKTRDAASNLTFCFTLAKIPLCIRSAMILKGFWPATFANSMTRIVSGIVISRRAVPLGGETASGWLGFFFL